MEAARPPDGRFLLLHGFWKDGILIYLIIRNSQIFYDVLPSKGDRRYEQ